MILRLFWRRAAAANLHHELRPGDDAPGAASARRKADPVLRVQRDFACELADIPTPQAGLVLAAVWRARSLQDLWHLRVPLFDSVARHFDQQQAEVRLARLNRHFPTRSPRSGLVPLITSFGGLER